MLSPCCFVEGTVRGAWAPAAAALLTPRTPSHPRRCSFPPAPAAVLQRRLQDAESLAMAGLELARGEAADATRLLGGTLSGHIGALADVARGVVARSACPSARFEHFEHGLQQHLWNRTLPGFSRSTPSQRQHICRSFNLPAGVPRWSIRWLPWHRRCRGAMKSCLQAMPPASASGGCPR
jgi:hypothetical protein